MSLRSRITQLMGTHSVYSVSKRPIKRREIVFGKREIDLFVEKTNRHLELFFDEFNYIDSVFFVTAPC